MTHVSLILVGKLGLGFGSDGFHLAASGLCSNAMQFMCVQVWFVMFGRGDCYLLRPWCIPAVEEFPVGHHPNWLRVPLPLYDICNH